MLSTSQTILTGRAQVQDTLDLNPYVLNRVYGSSEGYFSPWAELALSKQPELRLGLGYAHMASGCTGWITHGAGLGASYLPQADWWGVTGTAWMNPLALNLALDFGGYRSFSDPVFLLRPRLGLRFVYVAIDYGFTISDELGRQTMGRHSLRLQFNYLRW